MLDIAGTRPLHCAAWNGHRDTAKMLLRLGTHSTLNHKSCSKRAAILRNLAMKFTKQHGLCE